MKLPRGLSGEDLVRALAALGYETTRQVGSHVRLTTREDGEHHVSVPLHDTLKLGTLNGILREVAEHFGVSRRELLQRLFG